MTCHALRNGSEVVDGLAQAPHPQLAQFFTCFCLHFQLAPPIDAPECMCLEESGKRANLTNQEIVKFLHLLPVPGHQPLPATCLPSSAHGKLGVQVKFLFLEMP